jgi:tRNA(Ile)-lysidine synthase
MSTPDTNNLLASFKQSCEGLNKGERSTPVVVAVSGGVDSVVLCHLCKTAEVPFVMAHCNFGLRGEESERDEQFVRALANKYETGVFVKKFDTSGFAEKEKISIQEAARSLRYEWFASLCREENFSFVFTGHHADDNIETLMMNFFRGTGLQGLTGIPARRDFIFRPLLNVRREAIVDYARVQKLEWIEDSSNASSKYTRNFFRNELIPEIKKVFPQVEENLHRTIDRFKNVHALYEAMVVAVKEELFERKGLEVRIPVKKILKYPYPALLFEIIKDYGFGEKQVKDIESLLQSDSGKFVENGLYQVIRHGEWLVIAPKFAKREMIAIEKDEQKISFEGGSLEFMMQKNAQTINPSPLVAQLDAHDIQFPLVLRKWKQGDYFYPFGMRKKKKLARFFIDQKLSKNRKEEVWVLESNKKILWVVGMRIDDRFRITGATESLLIITYKNEVFGR